MNIYEMVERIIELTEKGKIKWEECYRGGMYGGGLHGFSADYQGLRTYVELQRFHTRADISIDGAHIASDKRQQQRLIRAIKTDMSKAQSGAKQRNQEKALQKARDILRG